MGLKGRCLMFLRSFSAPDCEDGARGQRLLSPCMVEETYAPCCSRVRIASASQRDHGPQAGRHRYTGFDFTWAWAKLLTLATLRHGLLESGM